MFLLTSDDIFLTKYFDLLYIRNVVRLRPLVVHDVKNIVEQLVVPLFEVGL